VEETGSFLKKFSVSEGDKVKAVLEDGSYTGIIIPSKKGYLDLKLDTGYNIGLEPAKIKSIEKLPGEKKLAKAEVKKAAQNPSLPMVSIVHTGGTIASRINYETGGVIASFNIDDILTMFPELTKIARIDSVFFANLMSEDLLFSDYGKIAKAIEKEIEKGASGVIVTHGTDTLHYTAAALSFILEGLPIPVLLVGCQRSSDRPSSDAGMNLVCAARFITQTDFAGVALCMHSSSQDSKCSVIPGTRARKMHTSRRDAFKAINSSPIAEIDYNSGEIKFLSKDYSRKSKAKPKLLPKFEEKVAILRSRPNLLPGEFSFYKENGYKGLILEATGIGHAPINIEKDAANLEALKALIDSGCLVCVTSQCLYGRVHGSIYTNSRRLKDLGTVFLEDMTTETAFIKLAWLLGNSPKKAAELMPKNLRGEISERRLSGEFQPGK